MAQQAAAEEVARLTGEFKRVVVIAGGELAITPLRAKQFASVLGEIAKLTESATQMLAGGRGGFNPLQLVLGGGEPALNIIAIAARRDRAFVDELELDDLARLADACYSVNEDFFDQRLAGQLAGMKVVADVKVLALKLTRQLVDRMISLMAEVFERAQESAAGGGPSPDSSTPATGAETSPSTPSSK